MKTRLLAALAAASITAAGCGTLQRLGVTDDLVATGVQVALEREGLAGVVTDEQVREVLAILKAEERLGQIADQVASQDAVQARIDAAVAKYLTK